ncbi:hypothetical protein COCON_G00059270 [Conger conger]|uniref:Uncharacterized protein n=1 Tax=Conger conger TaxID=82655 RepID=A0A9Q1DQY3_CONCO|nr:hypothetical protein COCON_G00059270 [Conger conger]
MTGYKNTEGLLLLPKPSLNPSRSRDTHKVSQHCRRPPLGSVRRSRYRNLKRLPPQDPISSSTLLRSATLGKHKVGLRRARKKRVDHRPVCSRLGHRG